jgi:glucose/arabinose dehydrogenase
MRHLNRAVVGESGKAVTEERLLEDLEERIRAVVESPEGWLYLSTDSGKILRLRPQKADD